MNGAYTLFIFLLSMYVTSIHSSMKESQTNLPAYVRSKSLLRDKQNSKQNISFTQKENWCRDANIVLKKKTRSIEQLQKIINRIKSDYKMPEGERQFQLERFSLFTKELNEAESMISGSFTWLDNVLKGDYKSIFNMVKNTKARLDSLRDAVMKEEQEYNAMLEAKESVKTWNQTKVEGILEEILQDVMKAADQLEEDLEDHVFNNAFNNADVKADNIQTVVKLEDESGIKPSNDSGKNNPALKLVDSQDNQFVLSKGKDTTIPHSDPHLILDVIYLVLLSFLFGWLCTLIGMPAMFGYVLAGIVLGPSGFNILKSLVQLESVGEFGVFFILFSVGLEFSPDVIKKVLKVAALGSIQMMCGMILVGLGTGWLVNASLTESSFIAACLALSSTPLVVKFLSAEMEDGHGDYGQILLGILVMQDVLLGLLMALLPNMASSGNMINEEYSPAIVYMKVACNILLALFITLMIAYTISRVLLGWVFEHLKSLNSSEITLLSSAALAFFMLMLTEMLHISMELGCFLAGVMISAHGSSLVKDVESLINPVKDFLACIFFTTIGLHVFPSFMVYEMTYLITLTMLTIVMKFAICFVVLSVLLKKSACSSRWLVSAGLAQVSEFSFVLGSRARRLGLISREVYLLILSVTTLSLLAAPLLWKLSLWQCRLKSRTRKVRTSPPMTPGNFMNMHGNISPPSEEDFVFIPHEEDSDSSLQTRAGKVASKINIS